MNKLNQTIKLRSKSWLQIITACAALAGFFATNSAVAQEQEISIAVVDQFAAILNTEQAKALTDKYKTELEAERGKLVALDTQVSEMEAKLEKERDVMSQSEMMRMSSEVKNLQLDRNVLIKKLRNRNQDAQQEIVGALVPKFEEVMKKIQEERKLDLILQKQAAIWAAEEYDITQEVTKKIDAMK